MSQYDLNELLKNTGLTLVKDERLLAGIGDDSAVIKISENLAIIQTIDVFTPIIDDPIIQGKICACNVLNDIYTMGVPKALSMVTFIAYPAEMPVKIATGMLKGFQDFCKQDGCLIVGGQTIQNPWPLMGGCAIAVADPKQLIYLNGAKEGDILLLTKPLGVQPAMAAYRLLREPEIMEIIFELISRKEMERAIDDAVKIMCTSNKPVAKIIQEIPINAATDITGFGLKGHTEEMAKQSNVDIIIEKLPIIKGTKELSETCGYSLIEGEAAETAGGMLISVEKNHVGDLVKLLRDNDVFPHIIGKVIRGTGKVNINKDVEIIECTGTKV
ncbi:MAG: selenide, water dikinase SelD [Candidatus Helarchaeota archaeon]